jgi:hypothetical protein
MRLVAGLSSPGLGFGPRSVPVTFVLEKVTPGQFSYGRGGAQLLTKVSTTIISWRGKGGRCVGMRIFTLSCADFLDIWEPQTPVTLWTCIALYRVI